MIMRDKKRCDCAKWHDMPNIVVLVLLLVDGHVIEHATALRSASDLPVDILSISSAAE